MKKEIKNIEASIRAKLTNEAQETHRPFAEILQYYAMERYLYRLSRSEHVDKFILKGALMFTVWQVPLRRTSLDIDFLGRFENQISVIEAIIKDVCRQKVTPDGLLFDTATVKCGKIKEGTAYEGVRVKFMGNLQKARISMQIDISFGDQVHPRPQIIDYPVILDFPTGTLECFLTKNKIKTAPATLSKTAKPIEAFLENPIKAIAQKKVFKGHWKAPGPWE